MSRASRNEVLRHLTASEAASTGKPLDLEGFILTDPAYQQVPENRFERRASAAIARKQAKQRKGGDV